MNKEQIKIAVLDTNINRDHPAFIGKNIKIITHSEVTSIAGKECGHGTAVCAQILKECPTAEITVFPIFLTDIDVIEANKLMIALEHILNDESFYHVINLSNGIVEIEDSTRLKDVCEKLTEKGSLIVAGYDNSGIMTFPACFPCVIGVDTNPKIRLAKDFEYIENSPINIRGYHRAQRVAWDNPDYIFASGSSFVVPYITGIISNILMSGSSIRNVYSELKTRASNIIIHRATKECTKGFNIKKAIVFPFNKEVHSLIKFSDELTFDLVGVYDFKYFMNIGKKVSEVIKQDLKKDYIIQGIEQIHWEEDFDTVIIGHLNEIIQVTGISFLEKLIDSISKYNKKIYAFDSCINDNNLLEHNNQNYFYPLISKSDVPTNLLGKMWVNPTPVLGVFGTRSKQGKFTLQLSLIKKFKNNGYNVGHLATEPTGWLFGADAVFPFGYSNTIDIDYHDAIMTLNNIIHNIQKRDVDIIITGCQSGTIPYDFFSRERIMIAQTAFLYGTLPDAIFLSVCADDDLDYIKRTISYIESSVNSKVIGIFVFPLLNDTQGRFLTKTINISGSEKMEKFISILTESSGIPVVELNEEGINRLFIEAIEFF